MTYLPAEFLQRLSEDTLTSDLIKLGLLIELREFIEENETKNGDRVPKMQIYAEAAQAMRRSPRTVRGDLARIRDYAQDLLVYWFRSGLSYDHLEAANELAETAKTTPIVLLNQCIDPGNATGETMTVTELEAFALGGRAMLPEHVQGIGLLSKLGNLPYRFKWDENKTRAFLDDLAAFRKRWFE